MPGATINIVVDASTGLANSRLKEFFDGAAAQLKAISEASKQNIATFAKNVEQTVSTTNSALNALNSETVSRINAAAAQAQQKIDASFKLLQARRAGNQIALGPSEIGGRGAGNWFAEAQAVARAGTEIEKLGAKSGNTRIAYMALGHVAKSTVGSLAAGISPVQILSFEIPRLYTAASFLGVGLGTIGAGLTALLPLIVTGGFAWSAYRARVQEANSALAFSAEQAGLAARNIGFLNDALKRGLISKEDFTRIKEYLDIASNEKLLKAAADPSGNYAGRRLQKALGLDAESNLAKAREEMRKLGITPDQLDAAEKFNQLMKEATAAASDDRANAIRDYQDRLKQINDLVAKNPALESQKQKLLDTEKAALDVQLARIDAQEKEQKKTKALQDLEERITNYRKASNDHYSAQNEFVDREEVLKKLFDQGIMSEKEFQAEWEKAWLRRMEGIEREKAAEERKAQQQKETLDRLAAAREKEDAGIQRGIEGDWRLTDAEKFTKLQQQGFKPEGPDPNSFTEQFRASTVEMLNSFGTLAQQTAALFRDTFTTAISSISQGITGLIMGTMTWGQALRQIGSTILNTIIQAIVEMGARWVFTHVLMRGAMMVTHAIGSALGWKQVAETNAQEAAKAPALATNAATSSIGSYGASAIIGTIAAIAAIGLITAAALGAFREGGYTGSGDPNAPAGIVHRGEYVIPADRVQQFGRPFFEDILSGAATASDFVGSRTASAGTSPIFIASGAGSSPEINHQTQLAIVNLPDEASARRWADSQEAEVWFNDQMRKHIWRYFKQ